MNYLKNCVFVDEAGFNINMRSPNARSVKGTPAIIETPTTRAITHTILGAITAHDVWRYLSYFCLHIHFIPFFLFRYYLLTST